MAGTIGKVVADAFRTAKPAIKGLTFDTLIQRKMQEMRREIVRLGHAVQQAEHAMAAGGNGRGSWVMDDVRGWLVSLAESQAYIDTFGYGYGKLPVESQVQQVATIARRRADVDRLLASGS